MALGLLGIVVGVVLFVILVTTVAAWWVAAISGLGVICLFAFIDAFSQWSRENKNRGQAYG